MLVSVDRLCARPRWSSAIVDGADGRQQREDVRFALRQAVVTQIGQVEADPVRRSMNRWNQAQ